MTTLWGEHWYARWCLMCGFLARKNEWDDTPPLTYCPRCGIELERLACRECGAPHSALPTQYCGYCGGENGPPHEPKMRQLPKSAKQDALEIYPAGSEDEPEVKPRRRFFPKFWE